MSARAIYHILSNDAEVSAIVGTKIFPNVAPQETQAPYLVFTVNSVTPILTKDSITYKGADPVSDDRTVTVNSYNKGYLGASDLAQKVRMALHGFEGDANGVDVKETIFQDQSEGLDFETDIDFFNSSFRMKIN